MVLDDSRLFRGRDEGEALAVRMDVVRKIDAKSQVAGRRPGLWFVRAERIAFHGVRREEDLGRRKEGW